MKDLLFYANKIEDLYEYRNFISLLYENGYKLSLILENFSKNYFIDRYFYNENNLNLLTDKKIKFCFIVSIKEKKKFETLLDNFFTIVIFNERYFSFDKRNKNFFLENSNYILNFYGNYNFENLKAYNIPYYSLYIEDFKKNLIKDKIQMYIPFGYDSKILKNIIRKIDKSYSEKVRIIINDIDNPYQKEDIELRNFKLALKNYDVVKFISKSNNVENFICDSNFFFIVSKYINFCDIYDSFVVGKPLIVLENSNINKFTDDNNSYIIFRNDNIEKLMDEILKYNINYSKIIHNNYQKYDKENFKKCINDFFEMIYKK